MKYPAVFRDTNTSSSGDSNQQTVLIYQDGDAIHLTGKFKGQYTARWSTFNAINITQEYLSNTWGVVESKEHAEFIVELCKVNDIEVFNGFDIGITNFAIVKNEVIFTYGKPQVSEHDKQITIPLPPKAEANEAGHNLVFASSECKEWPCVCDEVVWGDLTHKGVVKSISDGFAWIKRDSGEYTTVYISSLKKPKTPEEALRDDVSTYLCDKYKFIFKAEALEITDELLTKYNITPKD